jgi:hypothetical protein
VFTPECLSEGQEINLNCQNREPSLGQGRVAHLDAAVWHLAGRRRMPQQRTSEERTRRRTSEKGAVRSVHAIRETSFEGSNSPGWGMEGGSRWIGDVASQFAAYPQPTSRKRPDKPTRVRPHVRLSTALQQFGH